MSLEIRLLAALYPLPIKKIELYKKKYMGGGI